MMINYKYMFQIRSCVFWAQRQVLIIIALSFVLETIDCLDCPPTNHSTSRIRYIELEGILVPLEKSLFPWSTTNKSDTCSGNMNTTATTGPPPHVPAELVADVLARVGTLIE